MMGFLFASIFLVILYSATTEMYWMTAYLIPTLFVLFFSYAFFDSIAVAEELKSGGDSGPAEDPIMEQVWSKILLNPRAAGYTLLIAGIIGVLSLFSSPINRWMHDRLSVDVPFAALVIPIALIVVGALLLGRARRRTHSS
jgi:Ca2+/Na+ antiporter